jgi:hypothetical protein
MRGGPGERERALDQAHPRWRPGQLLDVAFAAAQARLQGDAGRQTGGHQIAMQRERGLDEREVLHVEHRHRMTAHAGGVSDRAGDPLGVRPSDFGAGRVPDRGRVQRHVDVQASVAEPPGRPGRFGDVALDQRLGQVLAQVEEQRRADAAAGPEPPGGRDRRLGAVTADEPRRCHAGARRRLDRRAHASAAGQSDHQWLPQLHGLEPAPRRRPTLASRARRLLYRWLIATVLRGAAPGRLAAGRHASTRRPAIGGRQDGYPSWRSRLTATLISARWVKACGKLPSCSPVGPISSA